MIHAPSRLGLSKYSFACLLSLIAFFLEGAVGSSANNLPMPPFDPGNEKTVPNASEFNRECFVAIEGFIRSGGWEVGESIITYNEKFNLVWRVDYYKPDKKGQKSVNRILCWRNPEGAIMVAYAPDRMISPIEGRNKSL